MELWKYTRRNGDIVVVRESLNKVVEWIKGFQEIGDVAIKYDPAHAALPWADIHFLLKVCKLSELHFMPNAHVLIR